MPKHANSHGYYYEERNPQMQRELWYIYDTAWCSCLRHKFLPQATGLLHHNNRHQKLSQGESCAMGGVYSSLAINPSNLHSLCGVHIHALDMRGTQNSLPIPTKIKRPHKKPDY